MSDEAKPFDMLSCLNALDDTPTKREGYARSPLNYMGSKDDSLPEILDNLPHSKVFVDVFGGSAQVLLAKRPSELDVYNDLHSGLAAFYRCLQKKELMDKVSEMVAYMPHSRELFIDCKETWEKEQDLVTRAAKWYYLVQCSFAGRARYFGRVTKGKASIHKKIWGNLELFQSIHERISHGVTIENLDWKTLVKDYDSPDTVFYMDPPYFGSNIYHHNFDKREHIDMCQKIFELEGFVALSGYENPIYDQFPWDNVIRIELKNNCATAAFNDMTFAKPENMKRDATRVEWLWIKEGV